ncbi:DNA polymerase-3 subunit epsilon [Bradyrhizobium diazoefficiens]|uniref:exonuclease domain-containing protein n=1 Tax=Bradyrhizobium TaxID=374 RepID=UPI000765A9F9|nr:exonuclease domain-containing protein [Bradyrhizobium diazoefficiens]MBR0866849.1 VRR-NUC domain-containing protein [Bradyrhizobium diazoefficiens]MBR0891324.1 VRR-NUC domain-containing protein [Bradyrhizobium diazoefficiens]MBR0923081.1 VRR-NUC domain-containing protein [Bradyrhizobium diazoefficiens]
MAKLPQLPVYYYLDHFAEMLGFVQRTYASVLGPEHHAFIARFEGLPRDARCLLVRMINRRGAIFNRSLFSYPEIDDVERAASDLTTAGHARELGEADYAAFVSCLPKDILVTGAQAAGRGDVRKSWSKPKFIDYYLQSIPFSVAAQHCGARNFIALDGTRPIEFLLYLYFGKTEIDLKNFALRDLGILRTNRETSFSARFTDAEEALASFHYSRVLDSLEDGSEAVHRRAAIDVLAGPACTTEFAADLRSRAAHQTGLFFEKVGESELARQLYRAGPSPNCNERLVRLLYNTGDKAEAEALLQRMIDDPASDEEHLFATDFYARKFGGQRTGLHTELLRSGRTITVDDTYRGNPEAGVAGVLRREGTKVFFTENVLWHTLFGLLFWDELFESTRMPSGFDWLPHCLKDRSFSRLFAATIDEKLAAIASGSALPLILRTVAARWGRPNGIFSWDHVQVEALRALLEGSDTAGIASIVRGMCDDFRGMRDGFPDLMLVQDGKASFMEVKAEGDVIRRNQLTRLRQLGDAGIVVEIGRVDYRFDPEQDYVVVDIETTGSWSNGDRITEIGAVKIRNHRVVDEWHSLLNPQRSIPAKIVQLTGITNEMVRDAPLFAEVADSFMQFMADGIFVAHNVSFDYGFITYEFERIGRRFRFPKLCTCAGMRRRYPGHKSYGLGKLCEIYGISLATHHRALCDARASAQLLNLINQKRSEERFIGEAA